jgi:hypothetical protein
MMSNIIKYIVLAVTIVLLNACGSDSKFHDLAQAIERNKLNIASIEVVPTTNKTIEINGTPCDPCDKTFLPPNKSETFVARGLTPDGQPIDISDRVVWSTSNSNIAQVNQNGTLTTKTTLGDVDVIASFASIEGKATVTVSSATLVDANIKFQDSQGNEITTAQQVTMCDTFEFSVIGEFSDSKRIITHDVAFSTNGDANTNVVVNEANVAVFSSFTPTTTSGYEVTATYHNDATSTASNLFTVNVDNSGFGSAITVTPATQTITLDTISQLTATATIGSESKDITNTTKWESDTQSVATINGEGVVTGEGVGQAKITASCGAISGSASVTVEEEPSLVAIQITDTNKDPIRVLTLNYSSDPDNKAKELLVIASYTNQDDNDITTDIDLNQTVIDVISGTTPIDVSRATGEVRLTVTALEIGVASLTVVYSGVETSITVNVEQ